MSNYLLLTIVCPDKPGLVSSITAELFDLGINLGDANFAVLGQGAEFTAVLETPPDLAVNHVEQALSGLSALEQADIQLKPFSYNALRGDQLAATHHILLEGDDQPGLVARLTELLIDYSANIVRMDARTLQKSKQQSYVIELWFWVPADRAEACTSAINNTAATLGMRCHTNETV